MLSSKTFVQSANNYSVHISSELIIFTEICRGNDFHLSGRPPSWICDDVLTLHPVIDDEHTPYSPMAISRKQLDLLFRNNR